MLIYWFKKKKTEQPTKLKIKAKINVLIILLGHDTDYLNLALRDGGVSLTMGLANGKQEMHIKPARVRFDDHQWHKVTVHRRIQEVCITNYHTHTHTHIIGITWCVILSPYL